MTPGEYSQVYTPECFPSNYPGSHVLGTEFLTVLFAPQRFVVPLDTGSLTDSVFTGTTYNVRHKAQVLFPWNVQVQRLPSALCRGRCLPVRPSVLSYKMKKFCCCCDMPWSYRDKRSFTYRCLATILTCMRCLMPYNGKLQTQSQLPNLQIRALLPRPSWEAARDPQCWGWGCLSSALPLFGRGVRATDKRD